MGNVKDLRVHLAAPYATETACQRAVEDIEIDRVLSRVSHVDEEYGRLCKICKARLDKMARRTA